ncbi:hypothetical protein H4Q26_007738 [Puccinia striiformis f. sp. tritici PST-130]|nr:hypothetical protein H4Q26_007738 [Puccinia striiformis f. sp. tritici PST-130]
MLVNYDRAPKKGTLAQRVRRERMSSRIDAVHARFYGSPRQSTEARLHDQRLESTLAQNQLYDEDITREDIEPDEGWNPPPVDSDDDFDRAVYADCARWQQKAKDFNWTSVMPTLHTCDAVRLLQHGYLAASPLAPQTAFSIHLMLLHNSLWNNCRIDTQPFMVAITKWLEPRSGRLYARGKKHARELRQPFSAAVDLYRKLDNMAKDTLFSALRQTPQEIQASEGCPACFGPRPPNHADYPPRTRNKVVFCLDGNFQHRHHTNAGREHRAPEIPRIFVPPSKFAAMQVTIRAKEIELCPPSKETPPRAGDFPVDQAGAVGPAGFHYGALRRAEASAGRTDWRGDMRSVIDDEETKLLLLLWEAKADLFVQSVHYQAENRPILDSKTRGSRTGTRLKEKVFQAQASRKTGFKRYIDTFNRRYLNYITRFPDQTLSDAADYPLTYDAFIAFPMDHRFWNDGLYYHCKAPWAIDANVRAGITATLTLDRVQEEFQFLAQELCRAVGWGVAYYQRLRDTIRHLRGRLATLDVGNIALQPDYIDAIPIDGAISRSRYKMIIKIVRLSWRIMGLSWTTGPSISAGYGLAANPKEIEGTLLTGTR